MKRDSDPGFSRVAPWLAALAGLGFVLLAFWPGYLSWDSAYQWWQARSGELDPTHPPVMVRVWQLARVLLPDPGGMLLLPLLLWWSSLALFADALGGGTLRRVATVLLIGLWPPLLALQPHLWKDVWMCALFALAVACLAQDLRAARRGWRSAAVVALVFACAFRFNALPAALPLLAWIAWREWPGRHLRVAAATLVMALGVQLGAGVLNHVPGGRDVAVWPSVAMWDIAAVSIAEDELLFPPDWVAPDLTVADLRRDFRPYVNVPSFHSGQLKLNYYYDYTPEQFARLRAAWLALPRDHAAAYAAHRATVAAYLFGLRQDGHPDDLVLLPGVVAYKDNPATARNDGALNRWLQPLLDGLVDTPLFAAWPYLLASLLVSGLALKHRHSPVRALAGSVAASALMLALPLVLLSPSSDFRYLAWCLLATGFAIALYRSQRALLPPLPAGETPTRMT